MSRTTSTFTSGERCGSGWSSARSGSSVEARGQPRRADLSDPLSSDRVVEMCRSIPVEGCSRGELGLLLKHALLGSRIRIGQVAALLANTRVGVANHPDEIRDVLPLPVPMLDKREDLILRAMRGGATLSDIRADFPRALPLAGRAA